MTRTRTAPGCLLAVLLGIYAVLAVAYNVANPLFESPDELLHYGFLRYVLRERALPITEIGAPLSENHQAPLYYVVGALVSAWVPTDDLVAHTLRNPFWAYHMAEVGRDNKNQYLHGPNQAFPYQGTALAVHWARLLSTLAGVLTVYWTFRVALRLLPGKEHIALATAAGVAFTPNFLLTSASVTNDAFVSAASVGIMLYILVLLDKPSPPTLGQWLTLGLALGVGALIKVSALPLLVVAAAMVGFVAWRQRSRRTFITAGCTLLGSVLLISGWWFERNLGLYYDLTGMAQMWRTWGTRPLSWGQFGVDAHNFFTSYWVNFGYGNVPAPRGVYVALLALILIAAVGWFCRLSNVTPSPSPIQSGEQRRRPDQGRRLSGSQGWLVAAWVGVTLISLFWYLLRTISVTGRQIHAIMPALSFCWVWGLARFVPPRWHTRFALLFSGAMLVLATGALVGILILAYHPAPRLSSAQA